MGIQKKHIIVGGIALVSVSAAILYWQFTKLKNGAIKFGGIKYNGFTAQSLNFDISLLFNNESKIKLELISQEYKVYLNDTFITTVSNPNPVVINKMSTSPISVNIMLQTNNLISALKTGYQDILFSPQNVKLRVDMKLKVKIFGLTFNIPYTYNTTLKELMTPDPNKPKKPKGK